MVKLLIFDFCGTLAGCGMADYGRIAQKLREFNLPVSDEAIAKLEAAMPGFLVQASSWDEFTNRVIQKLGIVLERDRREQLAVFLEKKLSGKLFSDALDILDLPQKKAILTLSNKFAVSGIAALRHFEIFSPELCGAKKPELKAFLAVLEKMGANPDETVMVGDSLDNDVFPAKAIGIKAVLIDRAGRFAKFNDPGVVKISSLKELKKHL
jgi:HAD superfamily hydrolase (TIGR01509 family)